MKRLWILVHSTVWGLAIATACPAAGHTQAEPDAMTARLEEPLLPMHTQTIEAIEAPAIRRDLNRAIAHSEVIVVTIPSTVELVLTQIESIPMPLTVYLAHPIQDIYGSVVIPSGTPVAAEVARAADGVRLITDAVVYESQLLPFPAVSALIPPQQIQEPVNPATPMLSLGTVGSGFGFLIGGEDAMRSGQAAGEVTGMMLHMLSDRTTEVLNIPAQTEWVLYRQ
ncbi:MAG: hypothetical protein AAFX01_05455 [Cyanobacteria bacterium J06638_28]